MSSGRTYGSLAACLVTAATTPPLSLAFLSFFFEPVSVARLVSFCFCLRPRCFEEGAGEESRANEPGIQVSVEDCWGSCLLAQQMSSGGGSSGRGRRPRYAGRRETRSKTACRMLEGGEDEVYVVVERSWIVRGPAPPYALGRKGERDDEGGRQAANKVLVWLHLPRLYVHRDPGETNERI